MTPKIAALIFRANLFASFIAGGLLWAGGAVPGFDAPTEWAFDFLNWPLDGDPGEMTKISRFMSAIGGSVLTALGVLNWLVVAPAVETREKRILDAALASVLAWVVIDSTGSILSGAAPNVIFNLIILSLYVGPILAVRKA